MSNEFDVSHPPFDLLTAEQQQQLLTRLDIGYFESKEKVIEAGQSSEYVFVVLKGAVAEIDPRQAQQDPEAGILREYAAEDIFGAISIINGVSRYTFQTLEETIAWMIPKAVFLSLLVVGQRLSHLFFQRIKAVSQYAAIFVHAIDESTGLFGQCLAHLVEFGLSPCDLVSQ